MLPCYCRASGSGRFPLRRLLEGPRTRSHPGSRRRRRPPLLPVAVLCSTQNWALVDEATASRPARDDQMRSQGVAGRVPHRHEEEHRHVASRLREGAQICHRVGADHPRGSRASRDRRGGASRSGDRWRWLPLSLRRPVSRGRQGFRQCARGDAGPEAGTRHRSSAAVDDRARHSFGAWPSHLFRARVVLESHRNRHDCDDRPRRARRVRTSHRSDRGRDCRRVSVPVGLRVRGRFRAPLHVVHRHHDLVGVYLHRRSGSGPRGRPRRGAGPVGNDEV